MLGNDRVEGQRKREKESGRERKSIRERLYINNSSIKHQPLLFKECIARIACCRMTEWRERQTGRAPEIETIFAHNTVIRQVELKTNSANSKLAANVCHEIHRKPSENTHNGLFFNK